MTTDPAPDLAERQATASPRDWPDDFPQKTAWNVCGDCNRVFLGVPTRIQCRLCSGRRTL